MNEKNITCSAVNTSIIQYFPMKIFLLSLSVLLSILFNYQSSSAQVCFASTSVTNATCNGLCNGTATATPGFFRPAPFTYSWNSNPVQTTQTATGLCAGSYTVLVTDNNGCTSTNNVTITQPSAINSSSSHTNVTCHGGTDGTATITVSGGGTYTYSWNSTPVQTTQTATNLAAGTYTCVATRTSTGCTTSQTVTITEPPAIIVSATSTPSLCGQANGTATLTASGGVGTLLYGWNTNPMQYSQTATGLAPGTYTGGVQDANGCIATTTVTVGNSGGPSLNFTTTGNDCTGGNNATATATPNGGTAPYLYSWNTQPVQTTQTATGLSAGQYIVTVTDNDGCGTTDTVTISDPTPVTAIITVTDVLCVGAANGSANAVGQGGTGPYTYSWDSYPIQNTQTANGLSEGVYHVTVTDDNGCTAFIAVSIGAPPGLENYITSTNATCYGAADGTATAHPSYGTPGYTYSWNTNPVQTTQTAVNLSAGTYSLTLFDTNGCSILTTVGIGQPPAIIANTSTTNSACGQPTGSATVTASGGAGNFTYSWNTNPVQTTATANNIAAGTYTVTVTDGSGCTQTATAIVQNSGGLTSSTSHTNVSCYGGNNGTAGVTPNGGTPGYTYSWNTQPVQTTQNVFNLTAGTYSVSVTDQAGCISTSVVTITQPDSITLTTSSVNVACYGGSSGSANAIVSGGSSPYTYSWNTNPVQTTHNASGLSIGDYIITVTDSHGCQKSDTITITQPSSALSAIAVHTNTFCVGGASGSATASPSGGTPPYTYLWNTVPMQTTQTAVNLSAGTYSATVFDANNCYVTATTTVSDPPQLMIEVSSTETSCNTADGTAIVSASGGTPGYSYLWNTNPSQTNDTATGLGSGTYSVIVTDANGCTQSGNATVTSQSGLNAEITATNVSCHGGNDGSAVIHVSGGSPDYSFEWNTNPVQTNDTAIDLSASTYTAIITDAGGCVFTTSVTITEPETISIITETVNIQCFGEQNGAISTIIGGGSSPYSYSWNTNPTETTQNISGLAAGDYEITVTDDNGCTATATATVTEPASALSATIIHTNVSCHGGNNGAATASTFGGTEPYSFTWDDTNNQTTQTAISLTAGTYSVLVTDASGCTATNTVIITEPDTISIEITSTSPACGQSDGTATATASGGTGVLDYSWNTNPVQDSVTAINLAAGIYTVTVSDENGCAASHNVTLNNAGGPMLQVPHSDVSCFGIDNGTASVTITGGTSPYTILWNTNPAQTSQTIFGLAPGVYEVFVTDSNGCNSFGSVTINEPTELTVSVTGTDPTCDICNDGSASATALGGTPPYSYLWSPAGQTTGPVSNLDEGTYCVTVTDANGCTANSCVTLTALVTGIVNASLSENSFTVYPNPTTGTITVELESTEVERITLTLTNMLGENITNEQYEVNGLFRQAYDLSGFAQGMYFITVRTEKDTLLRKVVKK